MITLWAVALVVFLIIEGVTAGLASIWFALGAVAALISAILNAPEWLQIVWFVVISGVSLWLTRPLAKKYVNTRVQPTNADRVIGMDGVVHETINNLSSEGTVHAGGKLWSARSYDGETIESGELVVIGAIEGVKLIVSRKEELVQKYQEEEHVK